MSSSSYVDSSVMASSDCEPFEEYKAEGYHPVNLGEVYADQYLIISKLGYGKLSTVWLCYDLRGYEYYAVKIMKSTEFCTAAGHDEIEFLSIAQKHSGVRGFNRVIQLHGHFVHEGPNGTHLCILLEVLGVSLLDVMRAYDYAHVPLELAQNVAQQVLEGLEFLHSVCKVIHTNLTPENILIAFNEEEYNSFIVNSVLEFKGKLSSLTDVEFYDRKRGLILTAEEQKLRNQAENKRIKKKRYRARKKAGQRPAKPNQGVATIQEEEKTLEETIKAINTNDEEIEKRNNSYKQKEQELYLKVLHREKPRYCPNIQLKIIDLSNSCKIHKHYTHLIQTRQYRSPEILLNIKYNHTADIWSFACIFFELITGEFLFKPTYDLRTCKEDDHFKVIIETLGQFPTDWAKSGNFYKSYFKKSGALIRVQSLKSRQLLSLLTGKFNIIRPTAESIVEFMLPMLEIRPEHRATATQILLHDWLTRAVPRTKYKETISESESDAASIVSGAGEVADAEDNTSNREEGRSSSNSSNE